MLVLGFVLVLGVVFILVLVFRITSSIGFSIQYLVYSQY